MDEGTYMTKKVNFGGSGRRSSPEKFGNLGWIFTIFVCMYFSPNMKDNDVSERGGGAISKFLHDVTYRNPF